MEDFHEITDNAYLEKIRVAEVTFLEIRCPKGHLSEKNAHSLADAISATRSTIALDLKTKAQEPEALTAVLTALTHCPALQYLHLSFGSKNEITPADVGMLSQLISNAAMLKVLDLSSLKLSASSQLEIIQACAQSPSLEKILFDEWQLSSTALAAVNGLLEKSSTLKSLCLQDNGINSNELRAALSCLAKNNLNVLEELFLGCNPIGEQGMAALADFIHSKNSHLKKVDLGFAELTDDCADALVKIIKGNTQLSSLSCGANQLGTMTLRKIAEAIKSNDHIVKLDLHGNAFLGPQRLAAIPTEFGVEDSNLQLLKEIEAKLSTNALSATQNNQNQPK